MTGRPRRHRPFRIPALTAWREELAAGQRSATTFDAMWRGACYEATALEFAATIPSLADACRRDARRIIRAAIRGAA